MTQRMQHQSMDAAMQQCITNCLNCHTACTQTVNHCLQMGGEHASAGHITALLDCAQSCTTSADFMLRMSPLHGRFCGVCAEACERCAEECERLGPNDAMMQSCAQACRRCAQSCREMASAA